MLIPYTTLLRSGRWEEAEKLFVQVMETRKTKLGADHPDTLTRMANLSIAWKSHGRHARALELMMDCAQARQRVLGPGHPDTLSTRSDLPLVGKKYGRRA